MFLKFGKIPEITRAVDSFLQKQTLTVSLQNSCSKELFGKVPGRPASVIKKDSAVGFLLGNMQNFSEQLFFQNTNEQMFPKTQIAFFWNTNRPLCMDE